MRKWMMSALALAAGAAAQADIAVTEIWAGGIAGTESTSDWFELTNYGPAAVDPTGWYYDDDSADPTANDPILGLGPIAPGESVIVLTSWEDDWATAADALASYDAAWDITGLQVGWVEGGGGLGSGGDAVFVFDSNLAGANVVATQAYITPTGVASFVSLPDGTWDNDRLAQVGVFGAYASAIPASDAPGIGPAIGSPGIVPEPASLALLGLGALALVRRR